MNGTQTPDGRGEEHGSGDQCLLPSAGATAEVDCGGSESLPTPEHGARTSRVDSSGGFIAGASITDLPAYRNRQAGLPAGISRRALIEELQEHQLDLDTFNAAYESIHARVQTVKDEGRMLQLVNWSGTAAVMGALELSIHSIERTMDEILSIIYRIDHGAIQNLDEE